MAAKPFDDIFYTCYGVPDKHGVVVIHNPTGDQVVQTSSLSDCCAFGLIVRDTKGEIARIALIHSISEHGALSAFDDPHYLMTNRKRWDTFCALYNNAASSSVKDLEKTLSQRMEDYSFINMLAYALHGVDSETSKLEVYCVMYKDNNSRPALENLEAEMRGALTALQYNVSNSGFSITPTHCFAIDGKGGISYNCIDSSIYTKIIKIESLLELLELEKSQCAENFISSFFGFFSEKKRKAIKIEFLKELKQKYITMTTSNLDGNDIGEIYQILAERHKVSPADIESTVLAGCSSRVENFLIEERVIIPTIPYKLTL